MDCLRIFIAISGVLILSTLPLYAAVINVPADQPTIQEGIDAAVNGDTVLVSSGTYTGENNRNISFYGKAITVAGNPDHYFSPIIDCQISGRGFVFQSGEESGSVLEKFSIRYGKAPGIEGGGGILITDNSEPVIRNVYISYCQAYTGAGLYCSDSSPTITDAGFSHNTAHWAGGGITLSDASPALTNCNIRLNKAEFFAGGGIWCIAGSTPHVEWSTITGNRARSGGGIAIADEASPTFIGCDITSNRAVYGGAIHCVKAIVALVGGTISGNYADHGAAGYMSHYSYGYWDSCSIRDNFARFNGGGINFHFRSDGEIINCTFQQNTADKGGGLYFFHVSDYYSTFNPEICQNTFIGNTGQVAGGGIYMDTMYGWRQGAPIIGGSESCRNTFIDNIAGAGADMYRQIPVEDESMDPYRCDTNTFDGNYSSDYYVSPAECFAFENCINGTVLVDQDLYVSESGNDSSDGLAWDTAFKTVQHALGVIETGIDPHIIHIGPGTYSPSATGEIYPLPLLDSISILGDSRDTTILDAENTARVWVGFHDKNLTLSDLTLKNGRGYNGGGMYCSDGSEPLIVRCHFLNNHADHLGGAFYLGNYNRYPAWETPVLGGSDGNGSNFTGNSTGSGRGSILGARYDRGVETSWNTFDTTGVSRFAFYPEYYFTLSNNTFQSITIQQDVYVAPHGDDNNTGTSPDSPFLTLQHAVQIVEGSTETPVTVYVAPGHYAPSLTGEKYPLAMKSNITILGTAPDTTILDAENTAPVILIENLPGHVGFLNLTITGGNGFLGGGIGRIEHPYSNDTTIAVYNCFIDGNTAFFGGGICPSDDTTIIQCTITNNTAKNYNGRGGGIYSGSHLSLEETVISNNTAAFGGGLSGRLYDNPFIIDGCIISGNHAEYGGGIGSCRFIVNNSAIIDNTAEFFGGGVYCENFLDSIVTCMVTGNTAGFHGGGLYLMSGNGSIFNTTIANNTAGDSGGGIYVGHETFFFQGGHLAVSSSTIADNTAMDSGGGICVGNESLTLKDCIVWDNSAAYGEELAQIDEESQYITIDISYTDIQNGMNDIEVPPQHEFIWGDGNIEADPQFATGVFGGWYLAQTEAGQGTDSPCLDAGSAAADTICFDLPDTTFCLNELTTRTDSITDTGQVDMGVHYPAVPVTPTPTPIPTETPTPPPTPSQTPELTQTPSPTPTYPVDLGVDLTLSDTDFQVGEEFLLEATLYNIGPDTYPNLPLIVLMDVYGSYFWYPGWTETFDWDPVNLSVGEQWLEILRFTWPDVPGQADGITIYGAILTPDFSSILGDWDVVAFGWSESW